MGQTAMPYGLYVRKAAGARRNTAGNTHYPVPANVTGAMYYGAPVAFAATGGVAPIAASPVAASPVCGVVQGAQWTSVIKPEWFPSLPGGTYAAGGRNIWVMVNDDPSLVMMIQASATLDLTAVGKVAGMLNWAAGNNSTGRSIASLNVASLAASGDFAFRIVGILDPGAPFPDVLVQWNTNIHSLQAMSAEAPLVAPDAVDPEEQNRIFEEFVRDRVNETREAQGLPPVEEIKLPGETDKAFKERRDKERKEDEEREKRLKAKRPNETDAAHKERLKGYEERENQREERRADRRGDRREDRQEDRVARREDRPAVTPHNEKPVTTTDKGRDK
jgi:hypothetical protein